MSDHLLAAYVAFILVLIGWRLARYFQPIRDHENEEIVNYIVRNGEQDGKPITRERLLEIARKDLK